MANILAKQYTLGSIEARIYIFLNLQNILSTNLKRNASNLSGSNFITIIIRIQNLKRRLFKAINDWQKPWNKSGTASLKKNTTDCWCQWVNNFLWSFGTTDVVQLEIVHTHRNCINTINKCWNSFVFSTLF